jgi:hypothetical protein
MAPNFCIASLTSVSVTPTRVSRENCTPSTEVKVSSTMVSMTESKM